MIKMPRKNNELDPTQIQKKAHKKKICIELTVKILFNKHGLDQLTNHELEHLTRLIEVIQPGDTQSKGDHTYTHFNQYFQTPVTVRCHKGAVKGLSNSGEARTFYVFFKRIQQFVVISHARSGHSIELKKIRH